MSRHTIARPVAGNPLNSPRVRRAQHPLPCHPILAVDQDLHLHLQIRERTPIHADDGPDRLMTPATVRGNVLVREVRDVIRREEIANRIEPALGQQCRVRGFDSRCL
jgi:hypothetical protein